MSEGQIGVLPSRLCQNDTTSSVPVAAPGNTRLDSQNPQTLYLPDIDWLDFRGTVPEKQVMPLLERVIYETDDVADWAGAKPGGRHVKFDEVVTTVRGAQYGYSYPEDGGMAQVWVSLPATALGGCDGLMGRLRLAKILSDCNLRCSRLDICLDDSTGRIAQVREDIKASYLRGEAVGFKKIGRFESWDEWNAPSNNTLYVGSRESVSFSRIYDKPDRTRWERQMRRDVADTVLADILRVWEECKNGVESNEVMCRSLISHLTNGIDFVVRKGRNLDRAVRVDFWREFLGWLGEIQVKITRQPQPFSIERTMGWIDRQCARTLAMARRIAGFGYQEWMSNLIARGESRFTQKHEDIIRLIQSDQRYNARMLKPALLVA